MFPVTLASVVITTLVLVSVKCDDPEFEEKVRCVIDTQLSSRQCRETAHQNAEIAPDRKMGCQTLLTFRNSLKDFNCTEDDFLLLKALVCDKKDVQCIRNRPGRPGRPGRPLRRVRATGQRNEIHSEDISKEKILCVIETKLTPGRCRDTAKERAVNGNDPKTACSTLLAFRGSLSVVGCTEEDFHVLKSVVCDKEDVQCTMPGTGIPNNQPNEVVQEGIDKDKILCIIETRISPGQCRDTARERSQNDHDPKNACNTLVTFKPTLKAVNCSDEDYEILKSIVCDHKDIPCTMPVTGKPHRRVRATSQRNEIHSEDISKEKILCVIETKLTPGRCRDTAKERAVNGNDPKTACSTLLAFRGSLSVVGCTEEDFHVLKSVVCDKKDVQCTMPGTDNKPSYEVVSEGVDKEKILCIIETRISPGQCRNTARERSKNDHDPKNACNTLVTFKPTLKAVNCSDEDYEILKSIVCDHKDIPCTMPVTGRNKIDKEKVRCLIETKLTPGRCRDAARERAKHNHDESSACTTLLSSKPTTQLYGCTNEDFDLLKAVVCDFKDVPCTRQPAGSEGSRRSPRSILQKSHRPQQATEDPMKQKVLCVIETQLSSERCKEAARNGVQHGHDPNAACPTLLAAEDTIAAVGCTSEDFQKLKAVVCEKRNVLCYMRRNQ